MKFSHAIAFALLVGSSAAGNALAQAKPWSVGVNLGITESSANGNSISDIGCPATCAEDRKDSSWGIRVSRAIDQNFGVDLEYVDLGTTYNASISGLGIFLPSKQTSNTLALALRGEVPLPIAGFSIFGRIGIHAWRSEMTVDRVPAGPFLVPATSKDSGIDPMLGIGARYAISPTWSILAEWTTYWGLGERKFALPAATPPGVPIDVKTVDMRVNTLSIGAAYSF